MRVERAPEPDDILFENLEVSGLQKFVRRLRTTTAMVVALLVCFYVILQASRYRQEFSSSIPNLAYCSSVVPQQYTAFTNNADISAVSLLRPPDDLISYYDSQCEAAIEGTFYAVYSRTGTVKQPVAPYSISACSRPSPYGLCPAAGEATYCPCLSVQATDTCRTYQCTTEGASSKACLSYQARLLADCFCAAELANLAQSGEGLAALSDYSQTSSTPQCKAFYSSYVAVEVLTYSATFLVVIIGKLLEAIIGVLNRAEKHSCVSESQGAYMFKIFLSLYINMALVVLIVFGRVDGLPSAFAQASVLQGIYSDFTGAWYGNVGAYLLLTFIVQVASVPVFSLAQYFVLYPLARRLVYPSIRKRVNTSVVIQDDLNAYEVGPVFETSYATAQSLALAFFAMTFASGLPLLMPLASVAFTVFFTVDKFLICRFYQRPPKISEGVIRATIALLPVAALIRLAVACWMLSTRNWFVSSYFQSVSPWLPLSGDQMSEQFSYALERLLRPNIFPLLVLFLVMTTYYPTRFAFRYVIPLEPLLNALRGLFRSRKSSVSQSSRLDGVTSYDLMKLNDELRQEAAPFSEQYYGYVLSQKRLGTFGLRRIFCCGDKAPVDSLTKQEQLDGWLYIGRGRYILKCKVWTQEVDMGYAIRRPGEFKKTFEVIGDAGCNSYNLASIPVYKKAIIALEQGAQNLELDAAIAMQNEEKQKHGSSPVYRKRLSATMLETRSDDSYDDSTSADEQRFVAFRRAPSMSERRFSSLATSDSEGEDGGRRSLGSGDDVDDDDDGGSVGDAAVGTEQIHHTAQNTLINLSRRPKPAAPASRLSLPGARSAKVAAVRFSL